MIYYVGKYQKEFERKSNADTRLTRFSRQFRIPHLEDISEEFIKYSVALVLCDLSFGFVGHYQDDVGLQFRQSPVVGRAANGQDENVDRTWISVRHNESMEGLAVEISLSAE